MTRKLKMRPKSRKIKAKPTKEKGAGGFIGRTASGFQHARKENKEREQRVNTPFRFYLKVGQEAELILLDDGEPYFFHEHQMLDPSSGRWSLHEVCIKEKSICPLCQREGKEGYYVMMLTCIDTRPYTKKDGTEVKVSRKLLPVKSTMIPKFERFWKRHGTFRGMVISTARDNKTGANIGDAIEVVKMLSEKELAKYKELAVPVNYEDVFPWKTEKELREHYHMGAPAGNEDTESDESYSSLD